MSKHNLISWRFYVHQRQFVNDLDVRRFWSHVNRTSDCWLWDGAPNSRSGSGTYGRVKLGDKIWLAHRASWLITYGDPGEANVCHHCDRHECVRPSHLFLGTQRDNVLDMVSKGRFSVMRGERNPRAKLTDDAVREIRFRYRTETAKQLATAFGMSKSMIGYIVSGTHWGHVT